MNQIIAFVVKETFSVSIPMLYLVFIIRIGVFYFIYVLNYRRLSNIVECSHLLRSKYGRTVTCFFDCSLGILC